MVNSKNRKGSFIFQDLATILLSVLVAIILIKTHVLEDLILSTHRIEFFGSFLAGMFFTSVFTTTPAIVTLGKIAQVNSILTTAFLGALGAVLGDLLIFKFVRGKLSDHFFELAKQTGVWRKIWKLLKLKYFRWGTFLLGGIILASPFPDELGISLMGLSKMNTKIFMLVSFIFNFVGILIIGVVARSL